MHWIDNNVRNLNTVMNVMIERWFVRRCQVQAIVPLMALVFPVVWRLLDLYGVAKIDLAFDDVVRHEVVTVVIFFLEINSTHSLCG